MKYPIKSTSFLNFPQSARIKFIVAAEYFCLNAKKWKKLHLPEEYCAIQIKEAYFIRKEFGFLYSSHYVSLIFFFLVMGKIHLTKHSSN